MMIERIIGRMSNAISEVFRELNGVKETLLKTKDDLENMRSMRRVSSLTKLTINEVLHMQKTALVRIEVEVQRMRRGAVKMNRWIKEKTREVNFVNSGALRLPGKLNHVKKLFNNVVERFNSMQKGRIEPLVISARPTGAE